ncbi:Ras GTPase-activating protein 2 [Tupaia chinensis]|uniref:Ras GTPase-activating protein 2 n=1 Tax=Tupaia chinensis TaxID=246437 RepID=L8YEY1_TUPCH|nr:Ras GTPase-activating protein 2 [Tupaia chinensis]
MPTQGESRQRTQFCTEETEIAQNVKTHLRAYRADRYLLQPRDNGNKPSKTDDLGSLRLNICYTEDYVLPSEYYGPLKTLLLKSPDIQENLRYYVDKLFSTIVKSSMSCPTVMCDIFYSLRQMATQRFPNDPHVQYSAVSSFVFLRFFAVAVVSPHTFHLRPHHPMFQVIHTEKPLYVQANNCVEANEWIDALCRVSRCNQNRLSVYHPSAYVNGAWLCCQETSENTLGCTPCTAKEFFFPFGPFASTDDVRGSSRNERTASAPWGVGVSFA